MFKQLVIAITLEAASMVSGGDYLDDVGVVSDDELLTYIKEFWEVR